VQDIGAGIPQGGRSGIELIDIVFAFSNIRLVRELVEDNLKQLETADVSKGQTEGLKTMIVEKQRSLLKDLGDVENTLESIINAHTTPGVDIRGMRNVQLNPDQSKAFVSAIVFSINHMAKFIPAATGGGGGLPESMI
jgi:hypothetical protein